MGRLSFALIIAACLILTTHFGITAAYLPGERHGCLRPSFDTPLADAQEIYRRNTASIPPCSRPLVAVQCRWVLGFKWVLWESWRFAQRRASERHESILDRRYPASRSPPP